MRSSVTGLVAAAMLVGGVAGCSLPEVLPLAGGTTSGPSPYGPWYEQHWATNSVLLSATDDDGAARSDDVAAFEENPGTIDADLGNPDAVHDVEVEITPKNPPAVESRNTAAPAGNASDFDESSPYQFPSSKYAPQAESAPAAEPAPAPPPVEVAPPSGGPIRY